MKKTKKTGALKIVRYADTGQFDGADGDLKTLIESAGRLLDKARTHEVCGCPIFQGSDGKWYTGSVEFVVAPVNKRVLRESLLNDKVECPSCKHIESRDDCPQDVVDGQEVDRCTQCNAVTRPIDRRRAQQIIRGAK